MNLRDILKKFGGPVAALLAPATGGLSIAAVELAKKLTGAETEKEAAKVFISNPELMVKYKLDLETIAVAKLEADAKVIESVGKTQRIEAVSDDKWQKRWRPTVGFTFAAVIINNYILIPWAQGLGLNVIPIEIPPNVWLAMGGVLGAAAWTRGREKEARVK